MRQCCLCDALRANELSPRTGVPAPMDCVDFTAEELEGSWLELDGGACLSYADAPFSVEDVTLWRSGRTFAMAELKGAVSGMRVASFLGKHVQARARSVRLALRSICQDDLTEELVGLIKAELASLPEDAQRELYNVNDATLQEYLSDHVIYEAKRKLMKDHVDSLNSDSKPVTMSDLREFPDLVFKINTAKIKAPRGRRASSRDLVSAKGALRRRCSA